VELAVEVVAAGLELHERDQALAAGVNLVRDIGFIDGKPMRSCTIVHELKGAARGNRELGGRKSEVGGHEVGGGAGSRSLSGRSDGIIGGFFSPTRARTQREYDKQ